MRRALLALAAVVAGTFAAPVTAAPSPNDPLCGFVGLNDPSPGAPAGTVTGLLFGGPITQNGDLLCTIQVGGSHHGDANNGAVAPGQTVVPGVVVAAELVAFSAPPLTPVYLCDQFSDGVNTYFFDALTGDWTIDPWSSCRLAFGVGLSDPLFDSVFDLLDGSADVVDFVVDTVDLRFLDQLLCPVLAAVASNIIGEVIIDAQGDVYIAGQRYWDCPPYDFDGASLVPRVEPTDVWVVLPVR